MPVLKDVKRPGNGGQLNYRKFIEMQPGEKISGILLSRFTPANSKFKTPTYKIFTTDHELIGLNGAQDLDAWMSVIQDNRYVEITYVECKVTKNGNNFHVAKVQEADDDDEVLLLKAAAAEADTQPAEGEPAQDKPPAGGSDLDKLFSSPEEIPF